MFPIKIVYAFLISPMRVTRPAHLISLDLITLHPINLGAGIAQWSSAGLRAGWSGGSSPAGAGNFSNHRVQTGFGAYPMGTRGSFPGG
jgi:hypothetical protein